jgi:rhodanese-related sulfurtransferase
VQNDKNAKIGSENMRIIIILALLMLLCGSALATDIPAEDFAVIQKYADAYLSSNNGTGGSRTIFAETLMNGDDPAKTDNLKDYYLLDVQSPASYDFGHIEGSVNVQLCDLAKPETLATLPKNKPILVICTSGHSGSIATAILDLLGYDAWTLRFGMLSWMNSTPIGIWSSDPANAQNISGGNHPYYHEPGATQQGCNTEP